MCSQSLSCVVKSLLRVVKILLCVVKSLLCEGREGGGGLGSLEDSGQVLLVFGGHCDPTRVSTLSGCRVWGEGCMAQGVGCRV